MIQDTVEFQKGVGAMDEILYEALSKYYHALELKGYMSLSHGAKLLVLCFFRDFVYHDYRGLLSKRDYCLIERALDCIYGTSCLIPYPDYLKMGKLHLGEITELSQRVETLEGKVQSLEGTESTEDTESTESTESGTQSGEITGAVPDDGE